MRQTSVPTFYQRIHVLIELYTIPMWAANGFEHQYDIQKSLTLSLSPLTLCPKPLHVMPARVRQCHCRIIIRFTQVSVERQVIEGLCLPSLRLYIAMFHTTRTTAIPSKKHCIPFDLQS